MCGLLNHRGKQLLIYFTNFTEITGDRFLLGMRQLYISEKMKLYAYKKFWIETEHPISQ